MDKIDELYSEYCDKCKAAIRQAQFLVSIGPDTSDPEAAAMLAYDKGWLCGRYEGCLNFVDDDVEEFPKETWVVYLCKYGNDPDVILPLLSTKDFWPCINGAYDQDSDQFPLNGNDWFFEYVPVHGSVQGYYLHRKLDLALECKTLKEFELAITAPGLTFANPQLITPEDWGW